MIHIAQIYRSEWSIYHVVLGRYGGFVWLKRFTVSGTIDLDGSQPETHPESFLDGMVLIEVFEEVKRLRQVAAQEYLESIRRINQRFHLTEEDMAKILVDPVQAAKEVI